MSVGQRPIRLLQLIEQPHVLDGDDRLVGKGFEEQDLLARERTYLLSANLDSPNGDAFSQQRCRKYGPNTRESLSRFGFREFGFELCEKVMDMDRVPVDHGPAGGPATTQQTAGLRVPDQSMLRY